MLEALGLDPVAEAVYRVMLARPEWTRSEIAEALAIDDRTLERALERLADMSLLRPSWEQPGMVHAVSPQVGLTALLAQRQSQLVRLQQEIEQGQAAMALLVAEYTANRGRLDDPDVERLHGLDTVRLRLEELAAGASFEALSFMPAGAQSADQMRASRPLDEAALRRGVSMRTVYLDSMRNDPPTLEYARWLTSMNGQIRTVPSLPVRMLVVDRAVALLPVDPEHSEQGAVMLRGRGIVLALCTLFEQVWASARPLGAPEAPDDNGLTGQERELLKLLADGHKDERVGRQLGISVRTARRMIAELMGRLNASSRFQAGVRAAARGWIDEEAGPLTPPPMIPVPRPAMSADESGE